MLSIQDFLSVTSIHYFTAAPSKRQAWGHLIGLLDLTNPNAALKAILDRETMESTMIAPGLALPHARVAGVDKIRAAIGISAEGIHDAQSEFGPIHVMLLFVGPADNMKPHLHFLARVSALFQKKGFLEKLIKAASPAKALEAIRKAETDLS